MLEVLFSDSAAGSLKAGLHHGAEIGGATSVIATDEKGHPLPPEEVARLQREAEERERRRWAEAVPLGDAGEILPLPLWLSVGPIDEEGIGPLRRRTLEKLLSIYPEGQQTAAEILDAARRRLTTLLRRAPKEPVRFWMDDTPDAVCGLGWVLDQLRPLGFAHLDLRMAELPARVVPGEDGWMLRGLGEMHPSAWGRLARQTRALPAASAKALAARWRALRQENAPLRAVVNGLLVSTDETLYDPWLRRVLDDLPDTFQEAVLIGRTLGQFPLGFGDAWLALRVEQWVADGALDVVTPPDPDGPSYHRVLRKTNRTTV